MESKLRLPSQWLESALVFAVCEFFCWSILIMTRPTQLILNALQWCYSTFYFSGAYVSMQDSGPLVGQRMSKIPSQRTVLIVDVPVTVTVTGWSVVSADIFNYKATGRIRVYPFVLGDCLTWTSTCHAGPV